MTPSDVTWFWETFDRYLAGDCPPDVAERMARLVASVPELHEALDRVVGHVGASAAGTAEIERLRARILHDVGETAMATDRPLAVVNDGAPRREHAINRPLPRRIPQRVSIGRRLAVGAALLVLGGIALRIGINRPATAPAMERYTAAPGQLRTVRLADGSVIDLAPGTVLDVPKDMSESRTVTLAGEAYFQITQAAGRPFIVQTGALATRVLGTRFDVLHDSAHHRVRVAVVQGRVSLSRASGRGMQTLLSAGMVGRVVDSTATVSADGVDLATSWTNGRLVFHMTPVAEVLSTVGQWYGYELRLADSSLAREPVVTAISGRSAPDALAVLATLLNVDMTFEGHVVTLRPRHHASSPSRRHEAVRDEFSSHSEAGR